MALGRQGERQVDLMVGWAELPRSPGHAFYVRLQAILVEAGLAFLGMSDPNQASWGAMLGSGREQIASGWYLTALPGLAIIFVVLALNLLGDGLNDALNPRLRRYIP